MLGVVAVVPVVVPLVGPPSWAAFAWAYQVLKYYLSTRYEGTKAQAHRHRHIIIQESCLLLPRS